MNLFNASIEQVTTLLTVLLIRVFVVVVFWSSDLLQILAGKLKIESGRKMEYIWNILNDRQC